MTENERLTYKGTPQMTEDGMITPIYCDYPIRRIIERLAEFEAIGTVEELQVLNRIAEETAEYVKEDKKILEAYKRIGTIEEFKALKEKNEPKKPLFSTIHGDSAYHCSICKKFVGFFDTRIYEYCHNCGQKLDFGKEE